MVGLLVPLDLLRGGLIFLFRPSYLIALIRVGPEHLGREFGLGYLLAQRDHFRHFLEAFPRLQRSATNLIGSEVESNAFRLLRLILRQEVKSGTQIKSRATSVIGPA